MTGENYRRKMLHFSAAMQQRRCCGVGKCHCNGHPQAVLLLEAGQFLRVSAHQSPECRLLALHHLLQPRLPSTPRARQDGLLNEAVTMETAPGEKGCFVTLSMQTEFTVLVLHATSVGPLRSVVTCCTIDARSPFKLGLP